ncbi:uncharacterized protein METZ01_LOCUS1910 [marine metagenome]|uniref:Uncharacterized protein n=1 Tax=marine metagenome TaxID=408172 RepID=A0A381N387_9ZZZZ
MPEEGTVPLCRCSQFTDKPFYSEGHHDAGLEAK